MTKATKIALIVIASQLLTAGLSGCHKASETSESTAPSTRTAADEAHKTPSSPGKPTAPIRIDHEIVGEPKAGEPLEIELTVASDLPGPMQVRLFVGEGLLIGETQESLLLADADTRAAGPMRERVVVVPQSEGRFYLSVHASVDTPEGEQMRVLSIPVQVGDKPAVVSPHGTPKSSEGETVISLPAKEDDGD